ncbi:MAG: T9SS type A sorting domain-containing protein [Ignavibacteriae bacterium]|nr:T9SS type A sorting domain-containing protein [Ignavibacteriota bacterium]
MVDASPFKIIDQINDIDDSKNLPTEFALYQNYPNPFNPNTTIKYSIPLKVKSETSNVASDFSLSKVTLKIYNILGREVLTLVNQKQKPGNYEVEFDAKNLSSGIYFYKLQARELTLTKKMILLK